MTTLADKIEALAKDATPGPWEVTPYYYEDGDGPTKRLIDTGFMDTIAEVRMGHDDIDGDLDANAELIATLVSNLPTILRALRERDQAIEALRLFVRLMNDPDYDLGELCEEFCTRAETILASIEGADHE